MTRENITTNLESVSAEAVTFKLEDWKPSKETSLQNQAYCSVQRMNINLKGCQKGEDNGCSRVKPIEIITVRKSPDVKIENEIGEFFRGLNFIAYTFTDDMLSTSVLSGLVSHIYLFETDFLSRKDGGPENITITIVVDGKAENFLEQLRAKKDVEKRSDGIYKFNHDMDFQVIVLNELPAKEKAWLEELMNHS